MRYFYKFKIFQITCTFSRFPEGFYSLAGGFAPYFLNWSRSAKFSQASNEVMLRSCTSLNHIFSTHPLLNKKEIKCVCSLLTGQL